MQKRSLIISGHKTSIALEAEFWAIIEKMAKEKNISIAKLIEDIDEERNKKNLASTLRVAALNFALKKYH